MSKFIQLVEPGNSTLTVNASRVVAVRQYSFVTRSDDEKHYVKVFIEGLKDPIQWEFEYATEALDFADDIINDLEACNV